MTDFKMTDFKLTDKQRQYMEHCIGLDYCHKGNFVGRYRTFNCYRNYFYTNSPKDIETFMPLVNNELVAMHQTEDKQGYTFRVTIKGAKLLEKLNNCRLKNY